MIKCMVCNKEACETITTEYVCIHFCGVCYGDRATVSRILFHEEDYAIRHRLILGNDWRDATK